jgi:hypothetical protein
MHLLHLQDDGEFSLVKRSGKNIPHYAILSHTWGSDDDEVTFQDIMERTGKSKAGYRKIRFCGEQAKQDRLQHFWVDTCCINKSSSAELSEAINSMFRWYRDAAKCYVYLSDVSVSTTGNAENTVAFLESRWFTRGWTLQELLAPACVEFFSMEGDLLGDKHSRIQEISKVTNIAAEALQGTPLSRFSVKERMAWAKERETTREEDRAYSLLGIFDIHMPLLYGEGEEKALKRLNKEIRESSGDAAAKTKSSTREARLSKIHQWLSAPDPSANYQKALKQRQHDTGLWFLEGEQYAGWKTDAASFLWLYGIPGCGKTILSSTILQNIFQHCDDKPGHAVAYFYFDFNDVQKQDAELMLRSLVGQLSQQAGDIPPSLDALFSSCEGGKRRPSLDSLLQVARRMLQQLPQVYVMLDALDECAQRSELMEMLETMAGWQLTNVHVIMTSRRERDIESSLGGLVDPQNSVCLQGEAVDKDIQQYVRQRLSDDKGLNKWGRDATLRQQIESALMEGSKGMCVL